MNLLNARLDAIIKEESKCKIKKHKSCTQSGRYTYDNPHKWFLITRKAAGHRQSPIALFTETAHHCDLPPISFQYYDVPLSLPIEIQNDGRTAHITINTTINGTRPSIIDVCTNVVYEVANIHFHWGSKTTKGTEHVIDGKKYDMEMHIVHKNAKFATVKDALEDPSGLFALAVLFEKNESADIKSTGLNAIYNALPCISEYESVEFLNQTLTMQSFLGDLNTEQYFTYHGSLTVPPCSEAVTWFVFPDIRPIQTEDLNKFYALNDERELPLVNNCRPLPLPLSDSVRLVFFRESGKENPVEYPMIH